MTFGVPLGSIFAPILFVYINDLTSMLQSDSYLFADQAKLFRVFSMNTDIASICINIYYMSMYICMCMYVDR